MTEEKYVYHLQVNLVKVKVQTTPEEAIDLDGFLVRQSRTYNFSRKEHAIDKLDAIMELVGGFTQQNIGDFILPRIEEL